jgi:hypothetical protein
MIAYRRVRRVTVVLMLAASAGCGRDVSPTSPSAPTSFLTGTWRGTVTIQVNPGDPDAPPPTSGSMTWTFEVVPQTNQHLPHNDSLDARVADDGDHRVDGAHAGQHATRREDGISRLVAVVARSGARARPTRHASKPTSRALTASR